MSSTLPLRGLERSPVGDVFPLTWAQETHWYLHQIQESLNEVWYVDISGSLRPRALERSLASLVRRQEILRTVFLDTDGGPCQQVRRSWAPELPLLDLSEVGESSKQKTLTDLEDRAAAAVVPLDRLPLIRWHLIRFAKHKHRLLIAFPHLLLDFSSREILVQELARDGAGSMPVEVTSGIQCSDVAARERLEAETESRRDEDQLSRPILPMDRLPARRGPGRRLHFPLVELPGAPPALRRRSPRSVDRSWFSTLFGVLLARWSGIGHAGFDVTFDLRDTYGAENLLGPLTERVPLTFGLPATHSVAALHWTVADLLAEEEAHRIPGGRANGHPPSMTDWAMGAVLEVRGAPATYRSRELELRAESPVRNGQAPERGAVLLQIQVQEGGRVKGFLEVEGALFDVSTGARLRQRLEHLARRASSNPNLPVRLLTSLTAAESQQLVHEWNAGVLELAAPRSLHRGFEEQVRLCPQAPAIRFAGRELSYREVDEQAGASARWLRTLGVRAGDRVGICVAQPPALAIGLLAVLKAGAAYLLLDRRDPVGRLAEVMGLADLRALVSEESILSRLPRLALPTVCIDPHRPTLGGGRASWPSHPAAPAAITVSFTNGPGLEVVTFSHRAVTAWARAAARLGADPAQGVALVAGPASDLCTVAAWTAWLAGGWWAVTDTLADNLVDTLASPSGEVAQQGAATIHLSPDTLLKQVADPSESSRPSGSRAQVVVFGAGPALDLWTEQMDRCCLPAQLTAVYGSPQGSPIAAAWRVSPRGRSSALAGGRLHLLDRGLRPCGIGSVGSLWIGEEGLPSQINGHPRVTADRLCPDPYSDLPGGRMLATLDRGRYSSAGVLHLVGREDRQLKVGGYRIEPAEIENCLAKHPEVAQCSVVRRESAGEKPQLVAFVVKGPPSVVSSAGASQSSDGGSPNRQLSVDETVSRILLGRPRRILEVGAEDLSLASGLAPFTDRYLVKVGLGRLRALGPSVDRLKKVAQIESVERRLEDFGGLEKSFDAVVLGSWIRHLPSVELFLRILDGAAGALQAGGMIFLAGVGNERLRILCHLRQVLSSAPTSLPAHSLLRRLQRAGGDDGELSLSPAFFGALRGARPWLSGVRVYPQRTLGQRLAPALRFDAALAVGAAFEKVGAPESLWREWKSSGVSLAGVRSHLQREEPESLGFTGVPFGSLQGDLRAFEELEARAKGSGGTVADILRARDAGLEPGVDPEDFWRLEDDLPYRVEVSWARSGRCGSFDVLLQHRRTSARDRFWSEMPGAEIRKDPPAWFAREPSQGTAADRFGRKLQGFLATKLPSHLVPRAIVVVPALPTLAADRSEGSVLAAETSEAERDPGGVPSTPTEEVVAGIWSELLGLSDPVMALSISPSSGGVVLATQLSRQLNHCFGIEIAPHQVLQAGTLAGVAAAVDTLLVEKLMQIGVEASSRAEPPRSASGLGNGLGRIRTVHRHRK